MQLLTWILLLPFKMNHYFQSRAQRKNYTYLNHHKQFLQKEHRLIADRVAATRYGEELRARVDGRLMATASSRN